MKKKWKASIGPRDVKRGNELVAMAGCWNCGIEVTITNPYIYSQGPVGLGRRK